MSAYICFIAVTSIPILTSLWCLSSNHKPIQRSLPNHDRSVPDLPLPSVLPACCSNFLVLDLSHVWCVTSLHSPYYSFSRFFSFSSFMWLLLPCCTLASLEAT